MSDTVPRPPQVRAVIDAIGPSGTPVTTPEVADEFDCTTRTIYNKLERLVEDDVLRTKKVGANARVWWRPPGDHEQTDGGEARVTLEDSTGRGQASTVGQPVATRLSAQKEAFRATAGGAPLAESLNILIRTALDGAESDVRAAFYVVDDDERCLHPIAATSDMPDSYTRAIDGLEIGADSLACGQAVHAGEPVLTKDVTEEPRWEPMLDVAEESNVRGCWSFPVETGAGDVVGTFAMYHGEPRDATPRDQELAGIVTQAAAIIISRHNESEQRTQAEAELHESEERLRLATDTAEIGVWELDLRTNESPNRSFRHDEIFGYDEPLEDWSLETFLDHVHPDDRERVTEQFEDAFETGNWEFECRIIRVDDRSESAESASGARGERSETLESGERGAERPVSGEGRPASPAADELRWITARGEFYYDEGEPVRAVGTVQDITERRQREERQEFSRELSATLRPLGDTATIQGEACRLLGEQMAADRAYFVEVDKTNDRAVVEQDYGRDDLPPLAREYPLSEFRWTLPLYEQGDPIVVTDVMRTDLIPEEDREAAAAAHTAWIAIPLVKSGELKGAFCVAEMEPREWNDAEVALAEETAERIWAAVERARAEEELRESEEKYRTLFESIEQGFSIVDVCFDKDDEPVDYRFLETNPAFEAQTGLTDAEGEQMRDLESDHEDHWFETYGRIARTGEPERFTAEANSLGERWFDVYAFPYGDPDEHHVAILFDDITERKEREQRLERQREQIETLQQRLLETSPTGIFVVNSTGEITLANDRATEILGMKDEEIVGLSEAAFGFVDPDGEPLSDEELPSERARHCGEAVYNVEVGASGPDGERVWLSVNAAPMYDDGELSEVVVTLDEITERKEAEEALRESEERFRALVTATSDAVYSMSPDWTEMSQLEGGGFFTDTDEPSETWVDTYIPDNERPRVQDAIDDAISTKSPFELEHQVIQEDGTTGWTVSRATPLLDDDGEITEWFGTANDITERKRAIAALEQVNDASRELMEADEGDIVETAATLMQTVLGVEFAGLWRYDDDTGELHVQDEHTDPPERDDIRYPEEFEDRAWQTFVGEELAVDNDLPPHPNITPSETPIRSGAIVPLGRYGVLYAGSTHPTQFDEAMVDLGETVAANVEAGLDRAEREGALATRTDELARVDRLNTVIRQIDQALVQADTREEIDRVVCERLADSDLYEFAWIGQHDAAADTVEPQEWAGVDSGYVDDLTITTDDTPTGQGPIGTAVRTRETQVVAEIATDPRFDPWRKETLAQGVRSCLSIPLVYEDALYGVLNVYAGTLNTDEKDRTVLAELGETIAHAISAVETKETLHTDRVVELTLGLQPSNSILGRLAAQAGCRIEFEGLVPQAEESSNVFFSAHDVSPDEIRAAGSDSVAVEELTRITEREDGSLFKARLSGQTLPAVLVEQDAVVRTLTFESDTVTAVVDLPSTATVREFIETLETTYSDADLLTRRTRERAVQTPQEFRTAVEDRLSARQQEALRTAYLGGFFQSPRESTGQDVAGLLDVSQTTFTHHLRAGQHTLYELLFEEA